MSATTFADLRALAEQLRAELAKKKFTLLYAYNGTGKTRLSTAFKDLGKNGEERDTLYFNAYTEDLFSWHNDLDGDSERYLQLHPSTKFFAGVEKLEMDTRIRPLLQRYVDFDFRLDKIGEKDERGKLLSEQIIVRFSREVTHGAITTTVDNIKISRGEENIFIWCFFLAIVQLAMDDDESGPYKWVKYIYIDDPISSLDEHNAITVANHLAQMLKKGDGRLKTVVSTHHTLFFNVLCNELKNAGRCFLSPDKPSSGFVVRETGDTPFFQHVASLANLYEAEQTGRLFTHHFNILRSILEKTASFHGYPNFSACIKQDANDEDGVLHTRLINILSHGNYSLYEPQEMLEENKNYFKKILHDFISRYPFNPVLFPTVPAAPAAPAALPSIVAAALEEAPTP